MWNAPFRSKASTLRRTPTMIGLCTSVLHCIETLMLQRAQPALLYCVRDGSRIARPTNFHMLSEISIAALAALSRYPAYLVSASTRGRVPAPDAQAEARARCAVEE